MTPVITTKVHVGGKSLSNHVMDRVKIYLSCRSVTIIIVMINVRLHLAILDYIIENFE